MRTINENSQEITEQDLILELEETRREEQSLRRELESLMPERLAASGSVADEASGICRREHLRGELLPDVHTTRLGLEAEIARRKAESLVEEAAPSLRRLEEARMELEEAHREWASHEQGISRARWQADRLRRHARRLEEQNRHV